MGRPDRRNHPFSQRDLWLVSFVLIKAAFLAALWAGLDIPSCLSSSRPVHAQEEDPQLDVRLDAVEPAEKPEGLDAPVANDPKDLLLSIQREREALRAREEGLKEREEQIRQEEARIEKVHREIEQKLETLTQIHASLQELIEEKKGLENEILRKLARVYESTPPEQAGPMLSRLDVGLAAQILIRMDGRKAGKIWGFVSPERASQISAEISRLQ